MIQRKQSIYLLLVILMGVLSSFLTLFSFVYADVVYSLSALGGMYSETEDLFWPVYFFPLIAMFTAGAAASLVMYKNRKNQMRYVMMNSFVIGASLIAMMGFLFQGMGELGPDAKFRFSFAALFLPLAFIFNILAYRGIKADDELIRSVDRIR